VFLPIVITNSQIRASSDEGLGIGSGAGQLRSISNVSIVIDSCQIDPLSESKGAGIGTISANSVSGSGIGSGYAEDGSSMVSTLLIVNGVFTASSGSGAGIGSGEAPSEGGPSLVSNLTILDGKFTVSAGGGAAIGSGVSSEVDSLNIMLGVFNLTSTNGTGIESGMGYDHGSFLNRNRSSGI
jgi:hypothetical protein